MRDTQKTRLKVIGALVQSGQSALELGKTRTTIAEYLRLSVSVIEEDAERNRPICTWVDEE